MTITIAQHCIFDSQAFEKALAAQNNNVLPLFKKAVTDGNEALYQAFKDNADTLDLVYGRAAFIDKLLHYIFEFCFKDSDQAIALLAVGGYGRGELHPKSDIDLMLLLDTSVSHKTHAAIEQFVMLMWDIKLEIGHSVRTIADCINEARDDITVATNIMEARHLAGNPELLDTMEAATGPDKIWHSKAFFQAKLDEQIQRHRKYHDTAYNLEPNIKENSGGLRDIQMIGWVAKRHFGVRTLKELIDHHFITQAEYDTLMEGQTLLWRIRLCLHYVSNRREDRLLFDLQRELASIFGYADGDNNLAIEQFMQHYYRTVMELERLNEMLLQLFREAILYVDESSEAEILNNRFQLLNGYIEARYPQMFEENPTALLELFLIMEMRPDICGVRAETIRLIRENRHLIDDKFRQSETAKKLFIDIIKQPRGVTHELRRMNRYGILAAYIPAFEQIVGRMQYDLFHAYTVDQHTLFVLRNMRRLSVPDFAHEFPLASGIFHHLIKPELLYLAGLFHDIAKGQGGRHEELGADYAYEFCQQHGLSEEDSQLVSWLVRKHLLMSMVAQRKDISDPEIISTFAKEVIDQAHLDHLYLLTLCDIRATNPKQWNSWKDNLLAELYHKASNTLHMGLENPATREMAIQETKTATSRNLATQGIAPERLQDLWQHFTDDYFLHHSPLETSWHSQKMLDHDHDDSIVDARFNDTGRIEIFIYTREHDNLFANIAAIIDQLGLSIVDAQVMSTDNGFTLDTFKAVEKDERVDASDFRLDEIISRIKARIEDNTLVQKAPVASSSRAHKHFKVETRVSFEQLPGKDITVLNITSTDRPGLLADIGIAFSEQHVRIHKAMIATAGEKATDTFYITDANNHPLLNEEESQQLRTSIIQHISQS